MTPSPSRNLRGRRRLVLVWMALAACLGAAFVVPQAAGWWARREAVRELSVGAIGPAEQRLQVADRFDANDHRNDLLRAACFRHLGQQSAWEKAIESAERSGARGEELRRELRLGNLQFGTAQRISQTELDALLQSGIDRRDAATAVLFGLLAKREWQHARELLDTKPAVASEAHLAYLRGSYERARGRPDAARAEFAMAVDQQPQHEPARAALGGLVEAADELTEAHRHYSAIVAAAPHRASARVDLARVLRKHSRLEDARSALGEFASPDEVSASVAIEMGEIEYDSGDYEAARGWFVRADLDQAHCAETLRVAASSFALAGDVVNADALFARIDSTQSRSRQSEELQRRLAADPADRIALEDLRDLRKHQSAQVPEATVPPLYAQHCAACHGVDGDGRGRAARHLFPRPRSFRTEPLRLVNTTSRIASLEDLERVIRSGVPGTAMPSFPDLAADERRTLAEQVQRFQREGVRERLTAELQRQEVEINEDDLRQSVADLRAPGDLLPVPAIGPATLKSIARGRELYADAGCAQCHGEDGSGSADALLLDSAGRRSVPRNLVRDPMKGGSDAQSLYRRIRLGMPGTPHPAIVSLSEDDLIALVHFCRSLSKEPKQDLTNHERAARAATPIKTLPR